MNKVFLVFFNIIRLFCALIIIWFVAYFLFGERFSITFTHRGLAEYLPQILTFGAAVSVYLLFILSIKSSRKKWQNILLFFSGLILSAIPLFAYHAYFQYQCDFWNREIKSSKIIYVNSLNKSETVKAIQSQCKNELKTDTVYAKEFPKFYFEIQHPVKIEQSDSAKWTSKTQILNK